MTGENVLQVQNAEWLVLRNEEAPCRQPRGPKWMGPANGGEGWNGVQAEKMGEAAERSSMPCPPQAKAFLRTFVAGQKYVAVRGRDPATLEPVGMRGCSPRD